MSLWGPLRSTQHGEVSLARLCRPHPARAGSSGSSSSFKDMAHCRVSEWGTQRAGPGPAPATPAGRLAGRAAEGPRPRPDPRGEQAGLGALGPHGAQPGAGAPHARGLAAGPARTKGCARGPGDARGAHRPGLRGLSAAARGAPGERGPRWTEARRPLAGGPGAGRGRGCGKSRRARPGGRQMDKDPRAGGRRRARPARESGEQKAAPAGDRAVSPAAFPRSPGLSGCPVPASSPGHGGGRPLAGCWRPWQPATLCA